MNKKDSVVAIGQREFHFTNKPSHMCNFRALRLPSHFWNLELFAFVIVIDIN